MALVGTNNAQKIWNWLKSRGFNPYACAGIIANLDCESGLNPKNLQDTYQSILGFTDDSYVSAIDSGRYSKEQFATDKAGAFLAQWTWPTRKRALYDYAKSRGVSIGDLEMQLEFFYKELESSYKGVLEALKSAENVRDATVIMMLKYEAPYDQSPDMQDKRVSIAQKYYTRFAVNNTEGVVAMGYKYYTKGQAVKVSDHFYSTEFDCHGSGCCSQTKVNDKLPVHLEMIRNHFNVPVTITSPYRCETHNRRIGGAVGSRHSRGDACDIVVKGIAPRTVAQYCESIGILGIGLYETQNDGYFVHIDERDYKSFWYGQSEQPRTTFGSYNGTGSSTPNSQNTNNLDTILNTGDHGAAVKALQEKLIKLGYSCGNLGADGDFGSATYQAVSKFQADYKLGVDGIAGNQTLAALDKAINALNATATAIKSVRITASTLNVRSGTGTNYPVVSYVKKGTICTVVEEKNGWGRIVNPAGWISGDYYENV